MSRELVSCVTDQCPSCAKLRTWAETAYSRGWNSCDGSNKWVVKEATEALRIERGGRFEDNSRLTEEILRLEEELERLKKPS